MWAWAPCVRRVARLFLRPVNPMKPDNLRCLVVLAASSVLSAQVAVVPSDHTTIEGSSNDNRFPFSAGVARFQAIYSNWDVKIPNGAQIKKIGVRADAATASAGHQIQVEVTMAMTTNYGNPSRTFATNHEVNPVVVFAKKIVALPPIAKHTGSGASPATVMLTLDTPYTYDASKHLVVDYRVYGNDNGNQPWAYTIDRASFYSERETFGQSCNTSGALTPVHSVSGAELGGGWTMSLTKGLPNADGALMLGVSNTTWNGAMLPISLGFLGAANCSLWIGPIVTVPIRLSAAGNFSATLRPPFDLSFYGGKVYTQIVFADLFAPGSIVSTNGAAATLGVAPQMKVVTATNNADATTGSVSISPGYVSVFEF